MVKTTKLDIERMIMLRDMGMSYRTIGREMKCSYQTVRRKLMEFKQ